MQFVTQTYLEKDLNRARAVLRDVECGFSEYEQDLAEDDEDDGEYQ